MGQLTALLFTATLLTLSARADVITISVSCMANGVEVTGDAPCSVRSGSASPSASFNYSGLGSVVDSRADANVALIGTEQATAVIDAVLMLTTAGPVRQDDFSYIQLDAHNMHLVWGDRRNLSRVQNGPTGMGGLQAYYGRVPFAAVTKGACGRS